MHKILMVGTLCAALMACGSSDKETVDTPATVQLDGFDTLRSVALAELEANQTSPAVSIAIYQNGEVVFAEAFGAKEMGGDTEVTKNTLFQLGSVTKMFTALGALKLVEQGMVQLDDKLTQVLPDMRYDNWQAQSWEGITIHDLLTHQSGIYDGYPEQSLANPLVESMTQYLPSELLLMNPPGVFYNYSNPNFSYLGAIIESYTQAEYTRWMKNNVFLPLGMQSTFMSQLDAEGYGDYALGVYVEEEQVIPVLDLSDIQQHDVIVPAGSYTWSTASDLLNMASFLFDGDQDVLNDYLRELIATSHVSMDQETDYGYGMVVDQGFELNDQWYEIPVWSHGGFNGAYTADFVMLPSQDIAIAILNSGVGDYSDTMIAALESVADLSNPSELPVETIDTAALANHSGTYIDYANDVTIEIGLDNDTLTIQVPELDALGEEYSQTLTYITAGVYYAEVSGVPYYFRFIPQEEGEESVYMTSRYAVGIKQGYEPWSERQD